MPAPLSAPSAAALIEAAAQRLRSARSLVLLLDYDGTLVPYARRPELARPDAPLRALLGRLAARPHTAVHLVSGRTWESLERWFGEMPVWLHAEHGFWSRPPGGPWASMDRPETAWREPALRLLSDFAARTPGALVEEKTVSLAWHYRMARPRVGAARAEELTLRLRAMLAGDPVEILSGAQVIEIRPSALHKGRMVQRVLAHCAAASLLAAIGDDRTDEDLFAALPPGSVAIHVGPLPSTAPLRLRDVAAARALLRSLLKTS